MIVLIVTDKFLQMYHSISMESVTLQAFQLTLYFFIYNNDHGIFNTALKCL